MAIVFVSPKQRQKMFLVGIVIGFTLFIFVVSLIVFLSKPKIKETGVISKKPDININFEVLDLDQVKALEPMDQIEKQFSYKAMDQDGKPIEGKISAISEGEALKVLQEMNFTSITLEEVKPGRDNPFTPYYQLTVPETKI